MWDLIVSVSDHCLSFYFATSHTVRYVFLSSIAFDFDLALISINISRDCNTTLNLL